MYYVQVWKPYPGWWQVLVPAGSPLYGASGVLASLLANPNASVRVYQLTAPTSAGRFNSIAGSSYVLLAQGTGAQVLAQLGFPQPQRATW